MNNPKISVIIPVYNVEKYLSECLDSIVNQTLKEIEIICINDGSTDNSLSILKEYASKDNRIKIIDKKNEGQGYARKVGLDIAKGKYILFCDSDDYYIELTAFEELYNYIENKHVDVVVFDYIQNNNILKEIKHISQRYIENINFTYKDMDKLFVGRVDFWSKIYSKSFLDTYDDWFFQKNVYYEDQPFHYQIILRATISYFKKEFYNYRIRNNSIMKSHFSYKNILDRLIISKEVYKIVKGYCNNLDFLNYFYNFFYVKIQDYLIQDSIYLNNVKYIERIIDTIKQFDVSDLFYKENKEAYFYIKAGLRMTPERYMEYLNKKLIKRLKLDKQNSDNKIKFLNEQLKQKNELIKTKNEQLQHKNELIKNRDVAIKQKNSEIQNLNNQNKKLFEQNNIQDQAIKRLHNSWSYRIGRLFTYPLSIPLVLYRFIRDYNLIKKSKLFDSEYYLSENEDVKNAKIDPIKHYLKFGWKEGRNPSLKFDGNEYLNERPDVKLADICPLVHYIKFGREK